jgi:hypothetical protein
MIQAYLVKVKGRMLETKNQKQVPNNSIFFSQEAADEFRHKLIQPPIGFHYSQVGVYNVELTIASEINYDDVALSPSTHCLRCRSPYVDCRCQPIQDRS